MKYSFCRFAIGQNNFGTVQYFMNNKNQNENFPFQLWFLSITLLIYQYSKQWHYEHFNLFIKNTFYILNYVLDTFSFGVSETLLSFSVSSCCCSRVCPSLISSFSLSCSSSKSFEPSLRNLSIYILKRGKTWFDPWQNITEDMIKINPQFHWLY